MENARVEREGRLLRRGAKRVTVRFERDRWIYFKACQLPGLESAQRTTRKPMLQAIVVIVVAVFFGGFSRNPLGRPGQRPTRRRRRNRAVFDEGRLQRTLVDHIPRPRRLERGARAGRSDRHVPAGHDGRRGRRRQQHRQAAADDDGAQKRRVERRAPSSPGGRHIYSETENQKNRERVLGDTRSALKGLKWPVGGGSIALGARFSTISNALKETRVTGSQNTDGIGRVRRPTASGREVDVLHELVIDREDCELQA